MGGDVLNYWTICKDMSNEPGYAVIPAVFRNSPIVKNVP